MLDYSQSSVKIIKKKKNRSSPKVFPSASKWRKLIMNSVHKEIITIAFFKENYYLKLIIITDYRTNFSPHRAQ